MRIVVTGADGFIGGHLVPKLIENNHELFLIGKDLDILSRKYGKTCHGLSYVELEHNLLIDNLNIFSPEAVIHLAAFSTSSDSYSDMEELFFSNILFLGKFLDALKKSNLKFFLYTGSATEYAQGGDLYDPSYLYSATKTAGRIILKYYSDVYNFKNISIIPYNVYGTSNAGKKILDLIYDSLYAKIPVNLTKGNQVLDFIHVDDLVELYVSAINKYSFIPNNSILYAGTGKGHTLKEVASLFEKISGNKVNINWGGIDYRKKDTMHSVANISETRNLCGWEPSIQIYEGLSRFIEEKKIINNNFQI